MARRGSDRRALHGALAGIFVIALAGCGGGGGDTAATPPTTPPTTPVVTVASVKFPAASGIAIVGSAKTIPVTVIGSDGKPMTGKTVAWSSSDDAIAAVDAAGVVSPAALGNVTITATVDGVSDSVNLAVNDAPADLAAFKALFPNAASGSGGFKVASDVNQAYSDDQLAHLLKAWAFFADLFPVTPGLHTEMYYTWDKSLLDYASASFSGNCRTVALLPGRYELRGRYLLTCSEGSINSWIVSPLLEADGDVPAEYATALSSVGQSFMDAISKVELYSWPWLWEGLSTAFKYGDFSGPGDTYVMQPLGDPDLPDFKALTSLLPLSPDLVALTRSRSNPAVTNTWSPVADTAGPQATMLLNYVFRQANGPATLKAMFADIQNNPGTTITTSQAALDYVRTGLGLASTGDLDTAYKQYASGL